MGLGGCSDKFLLSYLFRGIVLTAVRFFTGLLL
jgi:hypothetical protein